RSCPTTSQPSKCGHTRYATPTCTQPSESSSTTTGAWTRQNANLSPPATSDGKHAASKPATTVTLSCARSTIGTTATHALSAKARSQPGNADQTNKASRPDKQYQRPNQSSNNYAKSSPPKTSTRRQHDFTCAP